MSINLYHKISHQCSENITQSYSTSFSLASRLLPPGVREAIYDIYGFVRLADEIVDTFHSHDKGYLLDRLDEDWKYAVENGISINPVLHSFQRTVRAYNIPLELIESFMHSMRLDLQKLDYNDDMLKEYIYGSADVVGLMCLKVFVRGSQEEYDKLKEPAMRLGSAFQKVNFLRDLKADFQELDRVYFPGFDYNNFTQESKRRLVEDIDADFEAAYNGIAQLPVDCRLAVFTAYKYYKRLLRKIESTPSEEILNSRIRVPNAEKFGIMLSSYFSLKLNVI